ncbi:CS1 type fimbrial major subunit [Enterobacter sp. CC120223-11]|uniref:CS1 type fimbrial major subunit n=1 Tax=Enterobacter sp. CC120223-11 TaxID=1378073 RepID=UPI000BD41461|nr:CS1 type fimbrial major subunit [Enterobacter sp. CC120223-11]SNY69782.1 CS1 type fimbrial major subunit [Enterobacter sp. CC120223-11]
MKMKFSKSLMAGATLFAMMMGQAYAADTESYDIKLKASIPSDEFHVRPVESGWIDQVQDMEFDIATNRLRPIEKTFQYKNTAGAIQAHLDPSSVGTDNSPLLFNGSQNIPLNVTFNNTAVSTTAKTVVSETDANTGGRTNLKISMKNDTPLKLDTYAGEYTGTVSVIFEPVVSTAE